MNVYDFDKTIYAGDSTVDFFKYSLKKNPGIIKFMPGQISGVVKYAFKKIDKTQMKERFFCFLNEIDAENLVNEFWEINNIKIYKWYTDQMRKDDIIISASPEFLLKPICGKLGIENLIASKVDPGTGKFSGENCRGEEKVRRLKAEFDIDRIDEFYSDSVSDLPLAKIADKAFLIKNGTPEKWR